eukprot:TRINITY_DN92621_c0_g1_i1.p1 TRINITY_DN92621_c0_g1~~TRINITY_DN92621_c0_g1_i1.p1  ORF type:complete len:743 (-),score=162.97 TRINITY_DN92621_c0_g1_i1:21-2249(-)
MAPEALLPAAAMHGRASPQVLQPRRWLATRAAEPGALTPSTPGAAASAVQPRHLRGGSLRDAGTAGLARQQSSSCSCAAALALATFATAGQAKHGRRRVLRRAQETKLAELEPARSKEVLPYAEAQPQDSWPSVLDPRKRKPELASEPESEEVNRQNFRGGAGPTVRRLMQSYLRMQDVNRIIRLGMSDPEGDGRGWAAVALCRLKKVPEAAKLAAGPDGETPCGYQTLRHVSHACAKVGGVEAAFHLSRLQQKCGRTKYITAGSRTLQSMLESGSLYLQSTADQMPKLLAGHGARVSLELEDLLRGLKNDILAITPHRRFLMLTEAFNQLIRWYGRARLIPQALRACEIMNELGVPRNDMTIHFLSKGCAQQYGCLKKAKRITQAPGDWPGRRPEVVFIGRVNSGKSAMINALFSTLTKVARSSKTRAYTRTLDFYEVNRNRAGLPEFMMVDTPGLGTAGIPNAAKITRDWPDLIYNYLRGREALKHVFHLVDARNHKLLPADKQLIHLLAKAQRRRVRYTIVITKIDVCKRAVANDTAKNIRKELAPYVDVDIMFASARSLRGVDHLWSKIWASVTETPRGRKHKEIGQKELERLRRLGPKAVKQEQSLSDLLEIPEVERPHSPPPMVQNFDTKDWAEEADPDIVDRDFEPSAPGERSTQYFDDQWGEDLNEDLEDLQRISSMADLRAAEFEEDDDGDFDESDEGLTDEELSRRWEEFDDGDDDEPLPSPEGEAKRAPDR